MPDPRPFCEILRQWSTFHPEFIALPRKFKVAINGACAGAGLGLALAGDLRIAAAGAKFLSDRGVQTVAVGEGRNTLQSLKALKAEFTRRGWKTAVLVTEGGSIRTTGALAGLSENAVGPRLARTTCSIVRRASISCGLTVAPRNTSGSTEGSIRTNNAASSSRRALAHACSAPRTPRR